MGERVTDVTDIVSKREKALMETQKQDSDTTYRGTAVTAMEEGVGGNRDRDRQRVFSSKDPLLLKKPNGQITIKANVS